MYQTLYYAAKYCSPKYCSLKYCSPYIVSGPPWLKSAEVLRRKKHNAALLYHSSMSSTCWAQIYCTAKYYVPKYFSMLSNGRTWVQYKTQTIAEALYGSTIQLAHPVYNLLDTESAAKYHVPKYCSMPTQVQYSSACLQPSEHWKCIKAKCSKIL